MAEQTPPSSSSRLGTAAVFGILSQLVTLAIGLWSTPHLLHGLGDAAYGALALVVSFATYFAYLELGLGGAYIKELAVALATNQEERAQRLFETAHSLYLRVGAVGTVGMLLLGVPYLSNAVQEKALFWQVVASLFVTAALFFASMALSAPRGLLFAAQRADLFTRTTLFIQPIIPLLQVFLVWRGAGLVGVLAVQAIIGIGFDLLMAYYTKGIAPKIIFRAKFHPEVWKELRSFSLYRFASQMSQQGQLTGDRVLLGVMLSTQSIAVYAVAASVAQRLRGIVGAITGPFFAAAAERYATEKEGGLATLFDSFGRKAAALLAISCAGATFLARPFLTAWVGPSYAGGGTIILQVLLFATASQVLSGLIGQATDAAGRPRAAALSTSIGLLISLLSSIPLVWQLGPSGAAFGFSLGSFVQLILNSFALGSLLGSSLGLGLLRRCALLPALAGLGAYLVMFFCPHGAGLLLSLPAGAAGGIAGLILCALLGVIRKDDLPASLRRRLSW